VNPNKEILYTPDPPLRNPLRLAVSIFVDNWSRRELCFQLFARNIKSQYRQTVLGFLWLVFPALATTFVWLFLRDNVVKFSDEGQTSSAYLLYVLVGMILWQCFTEAYMAPLNAFSSNRQMLVKINFPREIVVFVSLCEVLFNAAVRSLVLIPFLIYYSGDFSVSPQMFLYPVFLFGLTLIGISIGIFLVPIGALYHDVGRMLTVISPIWMVLTPVIYPVPESSPANFLVYLNVASPALITARDAMLGSPMTLMPFTIAMIGIYIPIFVFGLLFYRIAMPIILERTGS